MKKLAASVALACALPAFAQTSPTTPASGTVTMDELVTEYTAGPHVNANLIHQSDSGATGPTCQSPVLQCDDFLLTLDFPEGIEEIYPAAIVRVTWSWENTSGAADFDCWIYDGDENLLDSSGSSAANPESAAFLLSGGVSEYILRCAPWSAAGESYTGKVEVRLGEPAFPLEEEGEAEEEGEGFAGAFVPGNKSSDGSANPFDASGAGALIWVFPLLGLVAIRRRRG